MAEARKNLVLLLQSKPQVVLQLRLEQLAVERLSRLLQVQWALLRYYQQILAQRLL